MAALADRLLVVGGNDGTSFLAVAECYEPHLNRWINIASLNKLRAGVGVASLHGLLYVVGGNDGTSRLDSVERYDPEDGQWEVSARVGLEYSKVAFRRTQNFGARLGCS